MLKQIFNSALGIIGTMTGVSTWCLFISACEDDVYGPPPAYECCEEFNLFNGNYDSIAFYKCMDQYSGPTRLGAIPNCRGIDYKGIRKDYQTRLDKCCKDFQEIDMETYQKCVKIFNRPEVGYCPTIEDIEKEDQNDQENQTDQNDQ